MEILAKNKYSTYLIIFVLLIFVLNAFILFSEQEKGNLVPNSEEIVEVAMQYMDEGSSYNSGKTFDCSGFTRSVYAHFNIVLPPSSKEQFQLVECTDIEQMGPGDLIFFKTDGKTISHVGIYLCNNNFIHSTGKYDKVRIDSLTHSYWKDKFICGGAIKRIIFN